MGSSDYDLSTAMPWYNWNTVESVVKSSWLPYSDNDLIILLLTCVDFSAHPAEAKIELISHLFMRCSEKSANTPRLRFHDHFNFIHIISFCCRILGADVPDVDFPPPLPDKEKRRSGNMYDLMSSTTSTTSLTPTQSPQNSILISPTGEILTPFSQSPHSVSPMSHSPSSSVGSGLNKSTEDLIATAQRSSRTNSITKLTEGQVMNSSSSSVMRSSTNQHTTFDEINSLTYKINQLTSSIDEKPPPIPSKQRLHRLMSTYDNVPDALQVCNASSMSSASRSVFNRTMESRISSSSTCSSQSSQSSQSTQSFMSVLTQKSASSSALLFCADRTSSQETYSSSETFSSATSHSSTESLPKPPPLPPKKRHSKWHT